MAESINPLAGLTCLLVDDEQFNVVAMKRLLKSWECHVLVARDGGEALLQLQRAGGVVAAVLMDIMMPGVDGYTAIRQIRRIPQYENLCIIALTAQALEGDREQCLNAGATDYLSKPVDEEALRDMLIRYLHPNA